MTNSSLPDSVRQALERTAQTVRKEETLLTLCQAVVRLFRADRSGRALDPPSRDSHLGAIYSRFHLLGLVCLGILPTDPAVSDLETQPVLPRERN